VASRSAKLGRVGVLPGISRNSEGSQRQRSQGNIRKKPNDQRALGRWKEESSKTRIAEPIDESSQYALHPQEMISRKDTFQPHSSISDLLQSIRINTFRLDKQMLVMKPAAAR
jgi:hypothetical protein